MTIQKDFIAAMRGFASTVNVVTSRNSSNRQAMTASAVTSLSMEPPSMLVCVNKDAGIHEIINLNSYFCINVLASHQQEIAEICSGKVEGEVRFETGHWKDLSKTPYLEDAQSNIFCKCYEKINQASHTIFLGEVINVFNKEDQNPLIYINGGFKN